MIRYIKLIYKVWLISNKPPKKTKTLLDKMGDNTEWSSDQMINNASNWSLAGDVAILNSLKKFSQVTLHK